MTSASLRTPSEEVADVPGESLSEGPLSAGEAAQLLKVGNYRMLQLCRSGEVRAYKPGRAWLIYRSDLDAYIKAHSNQPADPTRESA